MYAYNGWIRCKLLNQLCPQLDCDIINTIRSLFLPMYLTRTISIPHVDQLLKYNTMTKNSIYESLDGCIWKLFHVTEKQNENTIVHIYNKKITEITRYVCYENITYIYILDMKKSYIYPECLSYYRYDRHHVVYRECV